VGVAERKQTDFSEADVQANHPVERVVPVMELHPNKPVSTSTPASVPAPTIAPTAQADQVDQATESTPTAIPVQEIDVKTLSKEFCGEWRLDRREGDFPGFLVTMGVPLVTRKILLSLKSLNMLVEIDDATRFKVTMRSTVRNVEKPIIVLDGATPTSDENLGTGDKTEVTGRWEGSKLVFNKRNVKVPEKTVVEQRYLVDGQQVVEILMPAKNASYKEIFVRN